MKRYLLILFIVVAILGGIFTSSLNATPKVNNAPSESASHLEKAEPTPHKDIFLTPEQQEVSASTHRFASNLLLESIKTDKSNKNIFISPMGICNILTMLANGASDKALKEITNVFDTDLEELNSFYTLLTEWLPIADNQVTFSVANSVWIDKNFIPSPSYMSLLKERFDTESFIVPLYTTKTKDSINRWCSDKTRGMIPKFLSDPLRNGPMFWANALYFDGKWQKPFNPDENTFEIFYSHNSKKSGKKVKMMHSDENIRYKKLKCGERVSIPYGNSTYSFNIYLPSEDMTFEDALINDNCLRSTSSGECILTMPKFDLSYSDNYTAILKKMGITTLFTLNSLSKISFGLGCGKILQKTKLEVSEEGARAAAITATDSFCGIDIKPDPPVVNVNRPFILSITATDYDIVLFAGAVYAL